MTEIVNGDVTVEHAQPMQSADLTAGMMMRNARDAAGLHVAALAVSMKIPVKKLEALEADRLDLLHDAVFVRALAASVCRTLKIDPAPVLQRLPLTTAPRLIPNETGINAPFRATGDAVGFSIAEVLKKPSAIVVLLLLAAGALVVLLPEGKLSDWTAELSVPPVKLSTAPEQVQVQQVPIEVPESSTLPEPSTTIASGDFANSKNPLLYLLG